MLLFRVRLVAGRFADCSAWHDKLSNNGKRDYIPSRMQPRLLFWVMIECYFAFVVSALLFVAGADEALPRYLSLRPLRICFVMSSAGSA